jgi:hypothetical protein
VNCSQEEILNTSSYRIRFLFQLHSQFEGWYFIVKFATDRRNLNITSVHGGELYIGRSMEAKAVAFLKETASTSMGNLSFTIEMIEEHGPVKTPHKGRNPRSAEKRAPPRLPDKSGPKPPPYKMSEQPWWPVEVEVQYTDCTCVQTMPLEPPIATMCHGSFVRNPTVRNRLPPPHLKPKGDVDGIRLKFHQDPGEKKTPNQPDKSASNEDDWVTCRLRFKSRVRVLSVDNAVELHQNSKFNKVHVIMKHADTLGDPEIFLEYHASKVTTTGRPLKLNEVDVECRRCDKSTATPADRIAVASGEEIVEATSSNASDGNKTTTADPSDIVTIAVQNVDEDANKPTDKSANGSSLDIARTGRDKNDRSDDTGYVAGLWVGLVGAVLVTAGAAFGLYRYIKRRRLKNPSNTTENADEERTDQDTAKEVKPNDDDDDVGPVYEIPVTNATQV